MRAAGSRGRLSIRARLTATIMALTAVVAGLAVWAGIHTLERQVLQGAIDRAVDEIDGLAESDFVEPSVIAQLEAIEAAGPDDEELGFVIDELTTDALIDDARFILFDLTALGLADLVLDRFGDGGAVNVLLRNGEVVAIDRSLADYRLVELRQVDQEVVVPQAGLEELAAVSYERFDADPDLVGRDVEIVVEEVAGVRIGLVVDTSGQRSALDGIRTWLSLAAAALVALAGGATWFLTGRALRPVGAITDRVDQITSGTLDGRVPEPGTADEIGVLARTMNRMLDRLERADLQRRRFVSDASHELRTPVAVLRSESEAASRAPETTTVGDLARVVLGETGRLEGLVEDLLTLARVDETGPVGRRAAGAAPVPPEIDIEVDVDVDEVVLAEAGRTRRLPVDLARVSAGRVRGRPDDLARAVGHLLDNAARHGESAVAVGVETEGDRVRIWVEDDGAGLVEEDRARVFDRFTRLDEARSRDRGGSGLGLAVVAETVAAIGGTVTVDRGPLGGARFVLDLPAA